MVELTNVPPSTTKLASSLEGYVHTIAFLESAGFCKSICVEYRIAQSLLNPYFSSNRMKRQIIFIFIICKIISRVGPTTKKF